MSAELCTHVVREELSKKVDKPMRDDMINGLRRTDCGGD
jgi:hypothetical protein